MRVLAQCATTRIVPRPERELFSGQVVSRRQIRHLGVIPGRATA